MMRTAIVGLSVFSAVGLGAYVLRSLGHQLDRDNERAFIRSVAWHGLLCGMSVGLIAAVTLQFIGTAFFNIPSVSLPTAGVCLIVGVIAISLGEIACETARGLDRPGLASWISGVKGSPILYTGIVLACGVTLLCSELDWQLAIGLFVTISLLTTLLGWISVAHFGSARPTSEQELDSGADRSSQPSPPRSTSLLATALPISLTATFAFLATQSDIFFAGLLPTPDDTAGYIAARRVLGLLAIPLSILVTWGNGIAPAMLASNQKTRLESSLRRGATVAGLPFLVVLAVALVFPNMVLAMTVGPGYESGEQAFRILALGQVGLVLTGACGILLRLAGLERLQLVTVLVAFGTLFLFAPLAAKAWGSIGLASVAAIVMAGQNLAQLWIAIRYANINTAFSFAEIPSLIRAGRKPGGMT